jgi:hypothetical protein
LTAETNQPQNLSTRVNEFRIMEYFYASPKHDSKEISDKTDIPDAGKPSLETQGDKERR